MNVGDICNKNVVYADQKSDLLTAALLMREYHVGSVVIVVDSQNGRKPVGIITDRDLVLKILASDVPAKEIILNDIVNRDIICIRDDDDIMDAIKIMYMESVRRVPVINDKGELSGILAMDDLIEILTNELCNLVAVIGRQQRQEQRKIHAG